MARVSYYTVAWLSLAMGAALVLTALIHQGQALSVGMVFGALLAINGVVRLWLVRGSGTRD